MIKIFSKTEHQFNTMGLGFLDDAARCDVKTEINKDYTLEIDYPTSGINYDKIQLDNIVYCKSVLYKKPQPYRIYEKSVPLQGNITIKAHHISYDLCGFTVDNMTGIKRLTQAINIINANVKPKNLFHFNFVRVDSSFDPEGEMDIKQATNLRDILTKMMEVFKIEVDFDGYDVKIYKKMGTNRGLQIRYGSNLTSLDYSVNNNNQYTGIFPFYARETSKTTQKTQTQINSGYCADPGTVFYLGTEFLYLNTEITERIVWLANEQMYIQKTDANWSFEGIEDTINIKNLIYAMVGNDPTRWWNMYKGTPPDSSEVITATSLNNNANPYERNWFKDSQDHIIYPEDLTGNKKYVLCNGPSIPDAYNGEYFVRNNNYLEDPNDDTSVRTWTHVFNGAYMNPNYVEGQPKDDKWLLPDPSSAWPIDPLVPKYTGEKYDEDGNFMPFGGDRLPFVILGPETLQDGSANPYYMKVYEWNNITERYKESGSGFLNKIKNLFRTITGKSDTNKHTDYVNLIGSDEYPDGVVYLNNHTSSEEYQKILSLDISEYVKAEGDIPTRAELLTAYTENKKEIEEDYKDANTEITAAFINVSDDQEYAYLNTSEHIELGDLVNINYTKIGINVFQRVFSLTFDVLKNKYTEISVQKEKEEDDEQQTD